MRFVFLGTGAAGGVPPIGVENSPSANVRRSRPALVLQPDYPEPPTLLLDAGPDIWRQWIDWPDAPLRPDAIILTHGHIDHIGGMGDFRYGTEPIPVFGPPVALAALDRFAALFTRPLLLEPHAIPAAGQATVRGLPIETVELAHSVPLSGLLIRHRGRFVVYLVDTGPDVPETVRAVIRDCDLLIINAPFMEDHASHIGIPSAVALAQEIGAKRLVLSHISHRVPQETLARIEAAHPRVTVAYDGMVLDV